MGATPETADGTPSEPAAVVLFDVTLLGAVRRSRHSSRYDRIDVSPEVREVVEHLHGRGVRLGVVTTGEDDAVANHLGASPVASLLDVDLVLAGIASPEALGGTAITTPAGAPTGTPPPSVLVATDRNDRSRAIQAGLRACPHPRLAWPVLNGMRLRYVRVTVPDAHADVQWRPVLLALPFVPIRVAGDGGRTVYAITTNAAAAQLDDLGFLVDRLGAEDGPLVTDVYLLRDDQQVRSGFLAAEGSSTGRFGDDADAGNVLASTAEGLYVAFPAGRSVESYHFDGAHHGHTESLLPDVSLLQPVAVPVRAGLAAGEEEPGLGDDAKRILAELTPEVIAADLPRYAGTATLDGAGAHTIRSRHILHPDNPMVVEGLAKDLESIGDGALEVRLHPFRHESRLLHNIEATLAGETDDLVLVTAHLDSTAAYSPGYKADRDDAPGADDDASGVVAVLNVARLLHRLAQLGRPRCTIRFVLFNAEEHGLVGSKAYASEQAARRSPIVAVFQLDMIGFNRQAPRSYEIHAGCARSPDVQERSLALAQRIGRMAQEVSPELEAPQVCPGAAPGERDLADGRSDHASFQSVGYAACALTEDFFAGPGLDAPKAEPNPNYHMTSDTFVDEAYTADIARAVAAAAWLMATM
ncbi:MAG TPA: M20/M25/M40 family metallo-hydrolase [Acidimicrobiales bacterium]|nr:M20/M25/M40 family metallo-hydrolase [Acidimicrobiales bacterium]